MGCLIEHYAGAFPLWLSPVQAIVLPIADRHLEYSQKVARNLRVGGVRVELDQRSESIGKKIRDAQLQKVPYMSVVGDNEVETETLAIRDRKGHDTRGIKPKDFLKALKKEVESKSI